MTSSTFVTPPVGSGSADGAIKMTKMTAKPFSSNKAVKLPSVCDPLPLSHRSS